MSMQDCPCSGYIVPLDKVTALLSPESQVEFAKALKNGMNNQDITDFLSNKLPKNIPTFSVYRPCNEDNLYDEMVSGEYYAIFDESDLFVKTPSRGMLKLQQYGITPEFTQWTIWG